MVSVTALYELKTFASEGSKLLPDICLADSRILYFWYVLKSIHKFFIEFHALQCLFVRGSRGSKNEGGVGLFQISQKEIFFHLLWQPGIFGGNIIMQSPFLHPSKKAFLSPSVWARREYTWTFNRKENLLIYFENCQDVPNLLE